MTLAEDNSAAAPNMNRLRWQCRRGVKELDAVLCTFLENDYVSANEHDQHLFIELLALEDDQLLAYFFIHNLPSNHSSPDNEELKLFVERIRSAFEG